MEQIPSISGNENNNNNNNNNNTSRLSIKLYFDQIIHRIRNYTKEEEEQEKEEEKDEEKKKKEKLLEINKEIKKFSVYRDPDNNSIFNLATQDGNNILLECCIYQIKSLCLEIVKNYGNIFDLGHYNNQGVTALIYSIKNNWFFYAAFLIDYCRERPFKTINELNIEKTDNQRKNALDYLFEKEKVIQSHITKYKLKPDGEMKRMFLLVELLGYYLYKFPHDSVTKEYINKICQDLAFYKPLLEPYFINRPYIKFTKQFCKPPVETTANHFQEAIPITRDLRNNNNLTSVAQPYIPILHLPDNFDENDSDDERIILNPKNMTLPTPLAEYDPLNPGQIITYPRPFRTPLPSPSKKRPLEEDDDEKEDDVKNKKNKVNQSSSFYPELGGNKHKNYNKKLSTKKSQKRNITNKKRFQNRKSKSKKHKIIPHNKKKKSIRKRNNKTNK